MRYGTAAATLLVGLMASLAFTPAIAQDRPTSATTQDEEYDQWQNYLEYRASLSTPPDEYYFFEHEKKKVVSYKNDRLVRICAGDNRHQVPLKVTYDDKSASVAANECVRVEAKEISLQPMKRLEGNAAIRAEVITMP